MTESVDLQEWMNAISTLRWPAMFVKRKDVDYFAEPHGVGIILDPAIERGQVESDDELYELVEKLTNGELVTVIGSGLLPDQKFVITMNADEFKQHWKGD